MHMQTDRMLANLNKDVASIAGGLKEAEKSLAKMAETATGKLKSGMGNLSAAAGRRWDERTGGTGVMPNSLGKITPAAGQGGGGQGGGGGPAFGTNAAGGSGPDGSGRNGAFGKLHAVIGGWGGSGGSGGGSVTGGSGDPFGGGNSPGAGQGKALARAAAVASAAWQSTPGVRDAVSYQSTVFPVAFATAGQYDNKQTGNRVLGAINGGASSPFDPMAAAAAMTYSGYTMNMGNTSDRMLTTAGAMYQLTGMNNVASVMGSMALSQGTGGVQDQLMRIGIGTVGPNGDPKDLGEIVDQLWQRWYQGKKITEAQLDRDIAMGFVGRDLQKLFGNQPALYQQAVMLLRLKAKEGGRSGIRLSAKSGENSAIEVAKKYGLDEYNSPMAATGDMNTSQGKLLMEASEGLLSGFVGATNTEQAAASAGAALIEFTGPLSDATLALKAFTQGLQAAPTAGPWATLGISALTSLFSGGGEVSGAGGSTTDSISARLSRGEFVINARAAQQIGLKNLKAMNSLGHDFGSGFASPSGLFAGGGGYTLSGNPVSTGDSLGRFPVPGGTITVDKSVGSIFQQFLDSWQSHPLLGGGRYDLTKGNPVQSYNNRKARFANATSDHAGWAIDIRTDVLPADNKRHMTERETAAVHSILSKFGGKLGWGGDYQNKVDEMHVYYKGGGHSGDGTESTVDSSTEKDVSEETSTPGEHATGLRSGGATGGPVQYDKGFSSILSTSLSAFGKANGRLGSFTSGDGVSVSGWGPLLASTSGIMGPYEGSTKLGSTQPSDTPGGPSTDGNPSAQPESSTKPKGNLSKWLTAAGFTGEKHREAWAIGMRESGGNPRSHNTDRSTGDNSYGLFQINMIDNLGPERDAKFKQYVRGYENYDSLFDPMVNIRAMKYMSQGGKNWSSWVSPQYGKAAYYYDQYAESASVGMERVSHDGPVNVHAGETIVPASLSQDFRDALRDALNGGGSKQPVNITLNIERASDAEAERFAKKVMSLINQNQNMERIRTR